MRCVALIKIPKAAHGSKTDIDPTICLNSSGTRVYVNVTLRTNWVLDKISSVFLNGYYGNR